LEDGTLVAIFRCVNDDSYGRFILVVIARIEAIFSSC